MIDQANEEV